MPEDEIFNAVVAAVTQIQEQSQRDLPPLHGGTCIIGDVPGCDSLVVVKVSIILTEILAPVLQGREIPDCILLGAGKNARPTLNEIAASVEAFIRGGKALKLAKMKRKDNLRTSNGALLNGSNGHS